MGFLLGWLFGVLSTAAGVFLWFVRRELVDLPQTWKNEPDENLRPWFVAIRRFFGGGPRCRVPPPGWYCTRTPGHSGPCAALPTR